ncbi:hypothetical protein [Sphingopyxis sp.]|jgi:hypothetical protein|uniref:hypothetical protein n=1 Tax=Sphingopyxis sp. TaxID=1908224 RepID=UPI002DF3CC5C|nr:hypothetical protein [Sphingopyxis sp.]
MKLMLAATALLLAASPAHAEPANTAAAPAAAPAAPAPANAQPFSRDTTLEALMANPAAKTATLTVFPDLDKHPAWDMIKAMSAKQIAEATGAIPEDKLVALDAALKDVK